MQILSVLANDYARNHNHLNQMHRLRAALFGRRLERDVTITEQGEWDRWRGHVSVNDQDGRR